MIADRLRLTFDTYITTRFCWKTCSNTFVEFSIEAGVYENVNTLMDVRGCVSVRT
jgi:hypothetical protein